MESSSLPRLFLHLVSLLHIRKHRKEPVCHKDHWCEDNRPGARIIYLGRKEGVPVAGPAKVIPMYN